MIFAEIEESRKAIQMHQERIRDLWNTPEGRDVFHMMRSINRGILRERRGMANDSLPLDASVLRALLGMMGGNQFPSA